MVPYLEIFKINAVQVLPCGNDPGQDGDPALQGTFPGVNFSPITSICQHNYLQRLLKHVVRCYLRLSDNTRACEALCQCLPDQLKDETFAACLKDDKSTKHWLAQLLKNIEAMSSQAAGAQQQQGGQQPAQQHQPPKGLTQPPALA